MAKQERVYWRPTPGYWAFTGDDERKWSNEQKQEGVPKRELEVEGWVYISDLGTTGDQTFQWGGDPSDQ